MHPLSIAFIQMSSLALTQLSLEVQGLKIQTMHVGWNLDRRKTLGKHSRNFGIM